MVLPPGVFITTTPRCVAASTSTLSTPTPARPTTRSFGAASMTLRVTLVSERTTIAADVLDDRQQFRFRQPLGQNDDLELRPLLQQGNSLGRHGVTH